MVPANCMQNQSRVALSPSISNTSLALDDEGPDVHLFEPSGYLEACLRRSN